MTRPTIAACAALFATCRWWHAQTVETTKGGTVGVERKQTMSVLTPRVAAGRPDGGAAVPADQAGSGQEERAEPRSRQTERVRTIAQRLIPQTAVFREDAPRWAWEVNVLSSNEVNAWCMPGGKIAVYSGLIEKLNATDDELAAVMGHEISHALREHARERMGRQQATGIGVAVLEIFSGVSLGGLGQTFAESMFVLPNSRENEQEADRIGVELAARGGYDPRAAVSLWKKMASLGGGQTPQWLSTHPSHETRIRDLQDYSQRVMPLYEKAKR